MGREGNAKTAADVNVGGEDEAARRLREEEERFSREMEMEMGEEQGKEEEMKKGNEGPRVVETEEVSDEDL